MNFPSIINDVDTATANHEPVSKRHSEPLLDLDFGPSPPDLKQARKIQSAGSTPTLSQQFRLEIAKRSNVVHPSSDQDTDEMEVYHPSTEKGI